MRILSRVNFTYSNGVYLDLMCLSYPTHTIRNMGVRHETTFIWVFVFNWNGLFSVLASERSSVYERVHSRHSAINLCKVARLVRSKKKNTKIRIRYCLYAARVQNQVYLIRNVIRWTATKISKRTHRLR